MGNVFTTENLKNLQALPFEQKLETTKSFIKHLLLEHTRPIIAWSGGRDSTVLLYLALQEKPDVDVMWVNTGIEFPECVKFIRYLAQKWDINLHIVKPSQMFWDVSEKYGWPILGKGGSGYWWSRANRLEREGKHKLAQATREAKISAACCRILKETPADRLMQDLGVDAEVTGTRIGESRQRFLIWSQRGSCFYRKAKNNCKAWPLAWWRHEDVLEFHQKFGIPHSPIYDKGHSRNGCWPCLMDYHFPDNKLRALRHSHPELWRFLILRKGLGKRLLALKSVLEDEESKRFIASFGDNVERIIEQCPWFFDSLKVGKNDR